MKFIKLFCCGVFLLSSNIAMAQEPEFTPYFAIETGFVNSALNEFELDGFNVESDDLLLKLVASYQFTPQWSAKVGATSGIIGDDVKDRRDDRTGVIVDLTGIRYETTLFSIEGGYTFSFNESWLLGFNAGVIVGKEKKEISICPKPELGSWIGPTCYSGNAISTSSGESTETSFIFGTSVMYNFSNNWGGKLGYNFSGYREGLTQAELLVQYRF